ncbi:MAG: hypothetical protein D3916_17065 [Candidatus Electrothrix sp. MAN1_4]|nr:hypothetical protein [Candidatus Electrothrix sp. MAN1_4]
MKFVHLLICCFFLSPLFAQANEAQVNLLEFLEKEHVPSQDLLPADITVTKGFEPGIGLPVGEAQEVHGTVFVIHHEANRAYKLQERMPVFRGDTLITQHDGRVSLLLADKSALVLAAYSKLVLNRTFYHIDTKKESRKSQLQLLFGRVRSFVSRITGDSDYTITTPTAIVGVRGTDFALVVGPVLRNPSECGSFLLPHSSGDSFGRDENVSSLMTAVVTGENHSSVEFADLQGHSPVLVHSLSMSGLLAGCNGTEPLAIGREALKILQNIGPELDQLQDMLTAQQKQPAEFMLDSLRRERDELELILTPVSPVRP